MGDGPGVMVIGADRIVMDTTGTDGTGDSPMNMLQTGITTIWASLSG